MSLASLPSAVDSFANFETYINGESKSYLHALRKKAMAAFVALGYPKASVEEWKYIQSAQLGAFNYRPSEAVFDLEEVKNAVAAERALIKAEHTIVMVNGRYCAELSAHALGEEVHVGSLSDNFPTHANCVQKHFGHSVPADKNGLTALNTAFMTGGVFICVEKEIKITGIIHLISVCAANKKDSAFCPRVLVVVGGRSSLSLVESHLGLDGENYLSNFVGEIMAGPSSTVAHARLVKESVTAKHVAHYGIHQESGSNYKLWNFSLSGQLIRHDIASDLAGTGSFFNFRGLDVGSSDQHIDTCLLATHSQPFGTSVQLVKGVFQDRSTGVFNGKIFVCEGADKTDALQVNKNLMLSDDAKTFTRPQLEIYADDVKCNHGATVGKIDDKALFYLQARGIDHQEAKLMMAQAFVEEILDEMDPGLMKAVKKAIRERLEHV